MKPPDWYTRAVHMALRMASPEKHRETGTWYLRERVPTALLPFAKGRKVTLPVGDERVTITLSDVAKLSLRTKDAPLAKERYRIASGALHAFYEALRAGPKPLTNIEISGLAGDVYRAWTASLRDDPGEEVIWGHVLRLQAQAREAGKLEQWIGPTVDALLSERGIVTDAHSRERLLDRVHKALTQAAEQLKRNAEGDYRPDPDADRFPEFKPREVAKPTAKVSFLALYELWANEAMIRGASPKSVTRWRVVAKRFDAFTDSKDISLITKTNVVDFKDNLWANKLAAKTVAHVYLAAIKTVLNWAVANDKLNDNVALTVKFDSNSKIRERESGYTDAEATLILRTCLSYERSGRETTHLANVKRWCPWILAFTGWRVSQVTGLTRESFFQEDGRWVV